MKDKTLRVTKYDRMPSCGYDRRPKIDGRSTTPRQNDINTRTNMTTKLKPKTPKSIQLKASTNYLTYHHPLKQLHRYHVHLVNQHQPPLPLPN